MFGAPDSDMQVEQTEKLIAASLEISNDEQDMEERRTTTKDYLCHHTGTGKQVLGGQEEQADKTSVKNRI